MGRYGNVVKQEYRQKLLAHRTPKQVELLESHLANTVKSNYSLGAIGLCRKFSHYLGVPRGDLYLLTQLGVYLHDIGKANPYAQRHLGNNILKVEEDKVKQRHSQLSSHIYLGYVQHFFKKHVTTNRAKLVSYCIASCIAKHHSTLSSITSTMEGVDTYIDYIRPDSDTMYAFLEEDLVDSLKKETHYKEEVQQLLIANKEQLNTFYLFSLSFYGYLCKADLIATRNFVRDTEEHLKQNVYSPSAKKELLLNYSRTPMAESLRRDPKTGINHVRNELVKQAQKTLNNTSKTQRLFYLEAGVGAGKTNISARWALQMLQEDPTLNRITYAMPRTVLSAQVYDFTKLLDLSFTQVDSVTETPYTYEDVLNNKVDYTKTVSDLEFWNYRGKVITFASLFALLFSPTKKNAIRRLSLQNQVIILDEVQFIDINYMHMFTETLHILSDIYNFKVLFMSATLCKNWETATDLVDYSQFRTNKYLANRNTLDFSYYQKKSTQEEVLSTIDTSNKRILLSCVTRKRAVEVYNNIKKDYPHVFLFTSETSMKERESLVRQLKEKEGNQYKMTECIIVATNVIEAGVDISMNIAIVDFTTVSSLEQVSGRVNREGHWKQEDSTIYLVNNEQAYFLDKYGVCLSNRYSTQELTSLFYSKNYSRYMRKLSEFSYQAPTIRKKEEALQELNFREIGIIMQLVSSTDLYVYRINTKEAEELKQAYLDLSDKLRVFNDEYDKNYLEWRNVLVRLQEYKERVVDKEEIEKLLAQYGERTVIFI